MILYHVSRDAQGNIVDSNAVDEAATDGSGAYSFGDIVVGRDYTVTAVADTYQLRYLGDVGSIANATIFQPTVGNTSLTAITLPDSPGVRGRVLGAESHPLGGVAVSLYLFDPSEGWQLQDARSQSNGTGNFAFSTVDGSRYTLKFSRTGYDTSYYGGGDALPDLPNDTNSFVGTDGVINLADSTMIAKASTLGKVAGENFAYCADNVLPANDDDSTGAVPLPFDLKFFGESYASIYVNNNGNVTFAHGQNQFTPSDLTGGTSAPIIAPFFADVDTTAEGSSEVTYGFPADHKNMCVNWVDVGYFPAQDDKLNTFQLILTSRDSASDRSAGDFDATFNYDQVLWETGSASGGSGGFGGTSAAAGFSAGTGDPGTYFQFAGSFDNGALIDGGPNALVSGKQNSVQNGRYIFEIRNDGHASQLGSMHGLVTRTPDDAGVNNAYVEACPTAEDASSDCALTQTGSDGAYALFGIRAGAYSIRVSPPGEELRGGGATSTVTAGEDTEVDNIVLSSPTQIPAGSSLNGQTEGVPSIYYQEDSPLEIPGCETGASSGTWTLTLVDGTVVGTGDLAQGAEGNLHGTIPAVYPNHGDATITTTMMCSGETGAGPTFDIYIDPSGNVVDQYGAPIEGATVSLLRSDTEDGDYTVVPDGSNLMSPSNRTNPDTTDVEGFFHWDVLPGWYKVGAEAASCTPVTTHAMQVPPERIDLVLKMTCDRAAPTAVTAPAVTGTPQVGNTLTVSDGIYRNGDLPTGTQWLRNGVATGSTGSTYLLTLADFGANVSARQTVQHGFDQAPPDEARLVNSQTFEPYTADSNVVAVTSGGGSPPTTIGDAPTTTTPPSFTGTLVVGETLTAVNGSWNTTGLGFSHQWLRGGAPIEGATLPTYLLRAADAGRAISVEVTAKRTGFADGSATSAAKTIARVKSKSSEKPTKAGIRTKERGSVTVTVRATGFTAPTGIVRIYSGKKLVGTGRLVAGNKGWVRIKLAKLKKGKYSLVARYSGSSQIRPSKSKAVKLTVKR